MRILVSLFRVLFRSIIGGVLFSLMFLSCAATEAHLVAGTNYSVRDWQTEDGLPQNSVSTLIQTRDGYLWIGTYGGLARFDGVRFQTFNAIDTPALADSQIVSLYQDSRDTLWIGHGQGSITRYENGRFEHVAAKIPANVKIVGFAEDKAHEIWVLGQDAKLHSVLSGQTLAPLPMEVQGQLLQLANNSRGDIWVAENGNVFQFIGTGFSRLPLGGARHSGFVINFCPAADGGLWMVRDWKIRKWRDGQWVEDRGPCPWGEVSVSSMRELRDGRLAVGTIDKGLYLIGPDGRSIHIEQSNGLPQNWIRDLAEDQEGTLWFGAGSAGMGAIHASAFSVLDSPDHWQGRTVLSVAAAQDGALWIGTEGAGLYSYRAGNWAHFGAAEGFDNLFIWSVAESPTGNLLAGTWGSGIYQREGDRFVPDPTFDHDETGPVLALQFDAQQNRLWVGAGQGLLYSEGGDAKWSFRGRTGASAEVCAVARDENGVVWFGLSHDGLGRLEAGKITLFHREDGLSSNSIQCLWVDGNKLWIGTADQGLTRLQNGRFSAVTMKQGLASNAICHIADDGHGNYWLSTHHGLVRVGKDALNRCADGLSDFLNSEVYDREEGLPTIEFSAGMQAAGCRTADGRLWFTSSKGLLAVDPTKLSPNPLVPPVKIESLLVDGKEINLSRDPAPLRLSPENQRLQFNYTALSFVAPGKVLFKIQLQGLDKSWIEVGTRRVAEYSHLPAGNYRFHVIARNNSGIWNEEGAVFSFTVLPFFWQTWWCIALAGLTAAAFGALGVRYETRRRMRRHLDRLEQERAVERERARIAQDIHDDIGATLTHITMLSEHSHRTESPQIQDQALDRIHGTAKELTRSLDEIVWAVDPRHDTLDSLVSYMGKYAQDFLAAAGVRCRLDLPMQLPNWRFTAQSRHHLFLAFKEALNNAVKHAAATEVRIALSFTSEEFTLTVKDNGRGLPRLVPGEKVRETAPSGNGLRNLQQRLAEIGGKFELFSEAGSGTTLRFLIPKQKDAALRAAALRP